jgi:hypothetical protein
MKKTIISIILLFALSSISFADGEIPTGNKTCNGSPCLVAGNESPTKEASTKEDNPILKYVKDFLSLLF